MSRSDSRSKVIVAQAAQEAITKASAPLREPSSARRRALRAIARRPIPHESKVLAAFREVGELTACDIAVDLQISVPHARLSDLRRAGFPICDAGWVRQPWGSGPARTLKLYILAAN